MGEKDQVTGHFFDAVFALASSEAPLRQRLADAYADHLLSVTSEELPPELRPLYRDLESRLAGAEPSGDEDPFQAAAGALSDEETRRLVECVVALYGRLAALAGES